MRISIDLKGLRQDAERTKDEVLEILDGHRKMGKLSVEPLYRCARGIPELLDRLEAAERERDELRKDAERYRWLRKGLPHRVEVHTDKSSVCYLISPRPEKAWAVALDAAVDAMSKERGEA